MLCWLIGVVVRRWETTCINGTRRGKQRLKKYVWKIKIMNKDLMALNLIKDITFQRT